MSSRRNGSDDCQLFVNSSQKFEKVPVKIMFCLSWRSHQNPARQETQTTNANRGDVLHPATYCTSNPPSNVQPTHPPKTVLHIDSLGKPSGAYTTHSFEQMRISRFPERLRARKLQRNNRNPQTKLKTTCLKICNCQTVTTTSLNM